MVAAVRTLIFLVCVVSPIYVDIDCVVAGLTAEGRWGRSTDSVEAIT